MSQPGKSSGISIKRQLAAAVLVAVLVASLASAIASAYRETGRRFTAETEALRSIASTLAASAAQAAAAKDKRAVAASLNAIRDLPRVKYALVTDADGRRLYEIGNGVVLGSDQNPLGSNKRIGPFTTAWLGTYVVAAPIIHGGIRVGDIVLIADVSRLRHALIESLLEALFAGMLAAMLAVLLSFRTQRAISEPIAALTRATEEIGRSADYSRSVAGTGQGETGRLIAAFNSMLSEIRSRDEALTAQRDTLADAVAERTAELAVAKDAAERANAAKSDFLATMSHEIRTPMNGMLVMAELLAHEHLPPKAQKQAGVILKSGQTLLALINDILDLSKVEAGHLDLESIPLDTHALLEDTIDLYSERAAAKGLNLVARVADDVPKAILGDPLRIRQIIANLVANALKFTAEGQVTIALSLAGDRLKFAVHDTGIGIPPDKLASVFEAFTQAEQSTTRRFGGTGIGLAICRRLVHGMGGSIDVASVVGEGSTFSFEIPLLHAPADAVPLAASPSQALDLAPSAAPQKPDTGTHSSHNSRFRGRRVLAVDDSQLNREVLAEALARLGVVVEPVESGEAAVDAAAAGDVDLIFMDGSMPGMDGFEATRRIRADEVRRGRPPVPIVALTAHVFGPEAEAWKSAGMSDYIAKPFKLATLRAALERWLAADRSPGGEASPPARQSDALTWQQASLIDSEVIEMIRAIARPGDGLVVRVIGLYREHAPPLVAKLTSAPALSIKETADTAHALKSLSRNIGALRVADLCEVIETETRRGHAAPADALAAMSPALAATLEALSRIAEEASASPAGAQDVVTPAAAVA